MTPLTRRSLRCPCKAAALAILLCAPALAQPTFRISPPVVKGATSPELRPDLARGKAIADDLQLRREIIFVEGYRDPDDRYKAPGSIENRVGNILNGGSPELLSGNNYDGCLYTGTYFSCPDPLASIYKNWKLLTR